MQQLKRGCWENTVSPTLPPGSQVALAYRVAMKISHHSKDRNWEKLGKLPPQQKLCRIEKSTWYLLSSKQFNFGMQSWQQITGRFYGLHLHNMHKLISLQRIKDYWGKIAFFMEQRKNEFFSGTFQFKMPQFSIWLLESVFFPGPTVTEIIPQSL